MSKKLNSSCKRGIPKPFGCHHIDQGINFSLFAPLAKSVTLVLFNKKGDAYEENRRVPFNSLINKTGNIWHTEIAADDSLYYLYLIDEKQWVLDPYAFELCSGTEWGGNHNPLKLPGRTYFPLCVIPDCNPFDWEDIVPPRHSLSSLRLYEMHLRGYTQDPSSNTKYPGKFFALIEKIEYLKKLNINAIELLPIFEFNECEYHLSLIDHQKPLFNYFGYSPISFFAPACRYAIDPTPGGVIRELKTMIKEMHRAGIEVILDVVYNHTAEGDQEGPCYSFRSLAPKVYYQHTTAGKYINASGCGNTINGNHPIVIEIILESLRRWVTEFHIDGFRFDLASIFSRGAHGEVLHKPPLIDAITQDPLLANVKLIAEAWDAEGLYQVGSFPLHGDRWAEWNGVYRDSLRHFIRGKTGAKRDFPTRLCGSQDLFDDGRGPQHSINFITSHDGFSLHDLVSYNFKHNLPNGEGNRDGFDHNESWNCGVEGETKDPKILALRERQQKNFLTALILSFGIPMLSMSDEYSHPKKGNNNSWCQDNELNWKPWNLDLQQQQLLRFTQQLLAFRASRKFFEKERFLSSEDIAWHGKLPHDPQWNIDDHFVACSLYDKENEQEIYLAFNMSQNEQEAILPQKNSENPWYSWIDTSADSPYDILENPFENPYNEETIILPPHTVVAKIGSAIGKRPQRLF